MNRLIVAAVIGIGIPLGLGAIALAQPVNPADAGLPPLPGVAITRAGVLAQVQQRFAAIDANHDGAVTRAELDAYLAGMRTQRATAQGAARAARRDAMFARLDTNHDGQISKAEFAARPAPGAGMGADGQGRMVMPGPGDRPGSGREWTGRHHGGRGGDGMGAGRMGDDRIGGLFVMLDTNRDGSVILAEASARALAMFDKADANRDGMITPEERRAGRDAMRGRGRRG